MRKRRSLESWTRRDWITVACGALAAGFDAKAHAQPADGPRVLIAGDSMIAGGFGLFLERALSKEHAYIVRRRGKSSSGLSRPDFFNWMKEAKRLVSEFSPDLTVVMFGGNDVQGLYMGKGKWIRWQEPGWKEEYARRVNAFCDIIAPRQQEVFWVGMPVMRPSKFHRKVQRVNTIYRAEMAIRPNATFVDIWGVLADEHGNYADRIYLDPPETAKRRKKRVRAGDGIHLSPAGAHHVKEHVLEQVLPALAELKQA